MKRTPGYSVREGRWILAAIVAIAIGTGVNVSSKSDDGVADVRLPSLVHYYFRFLPAYEYAECAFTVTFPKNLVAAADFPATIMQEFGEYLYRNEPEAALYSYKGMPIGSGYAFNIDFADKCDQAPRILKEGLASVLGRPSSDFDVRSQFDRPSDAPVKKQGWLNGDDEDRLYWRLRERAYQSCDVADWLALAHRQTESGGSVSV